MALQPAAEAVVTRRDAVMWAWRAHNEVGLALHDDLDHSGTWHEANGAIGLVSMTPHLGCGPGTSILM